jgi:hypothetical protein
VLQDLQRVDEVGAAGHVPRVGGKAAGHVDDVPGAAVLGQPIEHRRGDVDARHGLEPARQGNREPTRAATDVDRVTEAGDEVLDAFEHLGDELLAVLEERPVPGPGRLHVPLGVALGERLPVARHASSAFLQ